MREETTTANANDQDLPIDAILSTIDYIIDTGKIVDAQLKDGFQPFNDIVAMLPAGIKAQEVVKNFPTFVAQAKNVDMAEHVTIVEHVAKREVTNNENAKILIKSGMNLAVALNTFIWDLRSVVSKGDAGTSNG